MDTQNPSSDYRSNVDTSRPFSSVKEAVAIFGERLLLGELYSPKPYSPKPYSPKPDSAATNSWKYSSSPFNIREVDDQLAVVNTLKKLEAELDETKVELKLLKKRESETEVALASLNAELHKSMSKLAKAEATAASKAVAATKVTYVRAASVAMGHEERRRDLIPRMEHSQTLAQILSITGKACYFGGKKERKVMKKKPIIPLLGDLFSRKKGSPAALRNSVYSSPLF